MNLRLLDQTFSVCKFDGEANIAVPSGFISLTRTDDEFSLVCEMSKVPAGASRVEADWRAIKVEGLLEFSLTGILSTLLTPLADAKISIFALSTFDTDYILVKSAVVDRAVEALRTNGHHFIGRPQRA